MPPKKTKKYEREFVIWRDEVCMNKLKSDFKGYWTNGGKKCLSKNGKGKIHKVNDNVVHCKKCNYPLCKECFEYIGEIYGLSDDCQVNECNICVKKNLIEQVRYMKEYMTAKLEYIEKYLDKS